MQSFDWNHLRAFVSVTEHGSLSRAAKALTLSQPTIGRYISALESDLGVQLFERTGSGLALTSTGTDLLAFAQTMTEAADRVSLAAAGHAESIKGTIRITASEIVAMYVLPDILTALHKAEPEIEIELVASNQTENLLQREADIAIRMYRPTQSDIIARKLGNLQLGMFAAYSYLEERGQPRTYSDLLEHDVIGYDRDEQIIRGLRAAGLDVERSFFKFRCDNQIIHWRMVVAGFGIGFNQLNVGSAEPLTQQIFSDVPLPSLPVWLTCHTELKTSRRVRRVYDFLAENIKT